MRSHLGRGNCKRSKCGSANNNLYAKSSSCLNSCFGPPNDLKQAGYLFLYHSVSIFLAFG